MKTSIWMRRKRSCHRFSISTRIQIKTHFSIRSIHIQTINIHRSIIRFYFFLIYIKWFNFDSTFLSQMKCCTILNFIYFQATIDRIKQRMFCNPRCSPPKQHISVRTQKIDSCDPENGIACNVCLKSGICTSTVHYCYLYRYIMNDFSAEMFKLLNTPDIFKQSIPNWMRCIVVATDFVDDTIFHTE